MQYVEEVFKPETVAKYRYNGKTLAEIFRIDRAEVTQTESIEESKDEVNQKQEGQEEILTETKVTQPVNTEESKDEANQQEQEDQEAIQTKTKVTQPVNTEESKDEANQEQ